MPQPLRKVYLNTSMGLRVGQSGHMPWSPRQVPYKLHELKTFFSYFRHQFLNYEFSNKNKNRSQNYFILAKSRTGPDYTLVQLSSAYGNYRNGHTLSYQNRWSG